MKIRRLYTIPELTDSIVFSDGLNIILGEKNETSEKENSVGKSLCIEFLNYALLKKKSDSRVRLIPEGIFPPDTKICVDFELNGASYSIHRSIEDAEKPLITENGVTTRFEKIEDATKFLTEKLFLNSHNAYPTFRAMLGPLIRDEKSEFKSIVQCYDTNKRIPDDYAPHLYLLNIDVNLYETIKGLIKEIDAIVAYIKRIKESVSLIRQKEIDDARSDLNELDNEVQIIEKSIDQLENISGYEIVKDEIISLENDIAAKRIKKAILKSQVTRLKPISQQVDISVDEIKEFYEELEMGLGEYIEKNLNEVIAFKEKIDIFQNKLIAEKRNALQKEIDIIEDALLVLDKKYSKCLRVLDKEGKLKNLKQTYDAFKEKTDELSELRGFVNKYDYLESEKQKKKTEKEEHLLRLQSQIQEHKHLIDSFEKDILDIHEFIQGNRSASFQLKSVNKKSIVEMIMRIDSDGGHSVDREKVFIYDIVLLQNQYTRQRHPGFLVHDNVFEVDQDTLIKSITYLLDKANIKTQQYILTLNSDLLEGVLSDDNVDLKPYTKATFTKNQRFLKEQYQEKQK